MHRSHPANGSAIRSRPDWGLGQIQSAIGDRVTVNFENAGKVLVNARVIELDICDPPDDLTHLTGAIALKRRDKGRN